MARTVFLDEPPDDITDIAAWPERRRALGQDLYDEVRAGEYHVAPAPHRRHGHVCDQVGIQLWPPARRAGLRPSGPANIGEPDDYRVPDRAYLRNREMRAFEPTAALLVEVVSSGGESYQKLAFYFAHGVEEALIVDPQRRTAEDARGAEAFARTGRSALLDLDEPTMHGEIDWPPE